MNDMRFRVAPRCVITRSRPPESGSRGLGQPRIRPQALRRLERHDERMGRIVECRFYGGMSVVDTAHEALGEETGAWAAFTA